MTRPEPEQRCPALFSGPEGALGSRQVVENIISAMSDGVMVVSPEGEIALVNQSLCEMLNLPREQMMGKGWAELFFSDPANDDFNQTVVEAIQEQQTVRNRQVSYHPAQGQARQIITTINPITHDGRVLGLVGLFKDVTELDGLHQRERKLLARSLALYQEKVESLDRIARAVAHEVRNPVTAIGGLAARLLKMDEHDQRTRGYLERILESTGRLEQIVAQVRAYAYVPGPNRRPVEVLSWLKELLAPYHQRAEDQQVELDLNLSSHGAGQAHLDPHLLATALHNILDNALDAMPDGGRLAVSASHADGEVTITVADDGPGIPAEDQPYLFDPFFTTKADRVGMSLAITKRIVNEHEGQLSVESPEGGGTTVTIRLPEMEPAGQEDHRPPQLK
jgi:PAS domain S-box-containing protein